LWGRKTTVRVNVNIITRFGPLQATLTNKTYTMRIKTLLLTAALTAAATTALSAASLVATPAAPLHVAPQRDATAPQADYAVTNRPTAAERLFVSPVIDAEIERVKALLSNPKLRWMFENCFPNTLDTTVRHYKTADGKDDTLVYTGDIHAMWLRDSGAQVWPYVQFANDDAALKAMLSGVIRRQFLNINIDPYANAFLDPHDPNPDHQWMKDHTKMRLELHERKWEIDSLCYPLRLAYHYWKMTGDTSVFDEVWLAAIQNILTTFRDQQRKQGVGPYTFERTTSRQSDTMLDGGRGWPTNPVGLIASAFRPSDDATTFLFLVPSNFFAVSSLRKAAEILAAVNSRADLAGQCTALADEVEAALKKYAVYKHPKYGKIYAFEVDGFGNHLLIDDANVPSLLAMPYLGDVSAKDPVYKNTRRFVWSEDNPYFFRGTKGEGIGGPHIGLDMAWPMSIMMKAFTSTDDAEIKRCVEMLLATDAETGFIHESFDVNDPAHFTRKWFAWQNTLFGELVLKLVNEGKVDLLNSIQ
jgi:meiotically up-regulated gene 157 (Mug157) protein